MDRRILIIEDNADIAELVSLHLRDMGCEPEIVEDGSAGLRRARQGGFGLIILDLMLPGTEGIEVCRRLRQESDYTPILMLTAKSSELDRVVGLEVGADDYLTKPFSIPELLARVRAILRRVELMRSDHASGDERPIRIGGLQIDIGKRRVTLDGSKVALTAREFDLLLQFARNPGRVYTRAQLLDLVWGYGHKGYEHTVNTHINRLRGKIEKDPSTPLYLLTVWGVGYKFFDPDGDDVEITDA